MMVPVQVALKSPQNQSFDQSTIHGFSESVLADHAKSLATALVDAVDPANDAPQNADLSVSSDFSFTPRKKERKEKKEKKNPSSNIKRRPTFAQMPTGWDVKAPEAEHDESIVDHVVMDTITQEPEGVVPIEELLRNASVQRRSVRIVRGQSGFGFYLRGPSSQV